MAHFHPSRGCAKSPQRNSVDWHEQHVTKPAQPIQWGQYIYRGCCFFRIPFDGPQPKLLAQKPNRKAAVFGGEMQMHYLFYGLSRHTCSNPQPGGPGDCVRQTSNH
ncbi:hypothetical protein T265_00042 [Opisthorchis viverrini]|uniref:Uncharacterized protein n=1 Tax=Opisthorchis viverrini TaxID=6198 RepID=A0A075ADG2_OPIVI|nr:hypothetical protein T265_00042 [Opisthorchis viverrini]KER34175.1 hypothetical protein T265_00042 [Opisthorchis viverrini]